MVKAIYRHVSRLLTKEQSLDLLKRERKEFYRKLVSVYCPILEADVFFRGKGFFHLINESNSSHFKTIARDPAEQRLKLMCLEHVESIITSATEIVTTRVVNRKDGKGRWKKTTQYSLLGSIDEGYQIRVIVEKVGTGELQFLSVMPIKKKKRRKRRSFN